MGTAISVYHMLSDVVLENTHSLSSLYVDGLLNQLIVWLSLSNMLSVNKDITSVNSISYNFISL